MKKVSLLTLLMMAAVMVACLVPAAASAADQNHPRGHKSVDVDIYKVPGEGLLQKKGTASQRKLDPREEAWFQNVQVRDQADTELCWAFAATTAAQISYIKETGDAGAEVMSPTQLGYFLYNRVNDPLGKTGGDANHAEYGWLNEGGAAVWTFQHLATWSGMSSQSRVPFPLVKNPSRYEYTGPESLDADLAYSANDLVLQNSDYYDSLPNTDAGINTVKTMIADHGAAVVSVEWDADYIDGVTFFNPKKKTSNNHEVTIVGWDDDYPASSFSAYYDGGYRKPGRNGAWLVMNSWGTEDEFGEPEMENGYFWASYDSGDILSDGIMTLDMRPAAGDRDLFQYDGNAHHDTVSMDPGEVAVNVYTAPSDRQVRLEEVGFTTFNEGATDYILDVYTGIDDPDRPTQGLKAGTVKVRTATAGYKTVSLPEGITIDPGETFSLAVRFKSKTYMGIEDSYGDLFTAGLARDQSYYYFNKTGKWVDASNKDDQFCFRIKGIAQRVSVPCLHSSVTTGETVAPTKNEQGYTVVRCTACGHLDRTDIRPMLNPVPGKTRLTSLKSGKRCLTVKWKKSNEVLRGSHITGYQIRYSTRPSMKGAKTVTVKGYKKTSRKVKGLKRCKKYYVQVRTYYKDAKGKAWKSGWSGKKAKKTK